MCCFSTVYLSVFFLFFFFFFFACVSWVGGRAHSRQLDCPLLVLLLFRSCNPLHWSLASLLIWGTISPADGSLLKHSKRSELIPISPVILLLSLNSLIPFPQHYSLISHPEHLIFPRTIKYRPLSNMSSNSVNVPTLLQFLHSFKSTKTQNDKGSGTHLKLK